MGGDLSLCGMRGVGGEVVGCGMSGVRGVGVKSAAQVTR